ncbi:hypothetical protein GALL_204450 [mine drainage metagenome]|uniref:Capsule polysaccharide biosynthesis protein n=1 Tax=mine drainage metagenome TaxID=410659 RepID=A0A1J5RP95_9ZZZZ
MENTIVWGFCGSDGREIVNELRASLNVTDWFSDQEGSAEIWSLLQGKIPSAKCNVDAVQSFGDFYQKHFQTYSVMIIRRGLNFSNFHELTNEFALTYYYFYELLRGKNIKLVIFSNIPHEGAEYVLYQLARIFEIKTLMCYQNIFPNQFFLTTSIGDFGCFQTIPPIFENRDIVLESGYTQKVIYMQDVERQQAAQQKGGLALRYFRIVSNVKKNGLLLAKILNLFIKSGQLNAVSFAQKLANRNRQATYKKQNIQYAVDRKVLKQLLSTSKHLVYFPLHLQPELTTSAIGGVFQDQLYALETLRALFGEEWVILVKENPKQNYFQRDELFFERLARIPGVYWVDKLFPSVEIIEKAALTATITGTAGWESIKGGGKCLVFGHAWYATLANCLTYHPKLSQSELADFLAKVTTFAELSHSFDQLARKAGVGVVDKEYNGLVSGYDAKSNALNVASSLMAVINHPATVWL